MGGTTSPADWKGDELGDERSVKEIPLTAHDQAIVRELWCRAVTYELYGKDGTPKDQRVLEVWNAWRSKIDAYQDASTGAPTFCGHPLDRVSSPAGLTHRWELASPVWEAACTSTRLVRRYIRVAADAAVTAGYVPTRAGILDPLLRDPLTVPCPLFSHLSKSIGLSRIVRISATFRNICQNSGKYIGTLFLQTLIESFLLKSGCEVGARVDQVGIGPMPTPLAKPPPSRPAYVNGDLHSLHDVIRDIRELIHLTDSDPRPLFNHLDFMSAFPYASRADWPIMIRKVKDDAFARTLEAAMGTPDKEDALVLQWETAWRARGHEKILQTYIHPDLIPYLRHSVTHPALPFLRDHIIRMETIPWKVAS